MIALQSTFMKKKMQLILLVLIVLFAILVLRLAWPNRTMNGYKIYFKIAVNSPKETHFELDKEHADFSHNQLVLNSIVGTLVKYGLSGKLEPYLAESWTVSKDNKIWKFKIRQNLYCEDGVLVTANLFKETLEKSLKEYSLRSSVIMFDHLLGWSDFKIGKTSILAGLSVEDDIVQFKFDKNPNDLLELLRMPYFGLWREIDHKIISSGPYSVKSIDQEVITLALRNKWFTVNEHSFKEISLMFVGLNQKDFLTGTHSITRVPFFFHLPEEDKKVDSYWISSPPTLFEGFVLSPSKNNFFDSLENRQIFKSRISALYPGLVESIFFYPSARTDGLSSSNSTYKPRKKTNKLTFALERTTLSVEEINKLTKIISYGLDGSQVEFEIIHRDLKDKQWFNKTDSNNYFDARVAAVDIGAYPNYFVINMMFCSKLGINFPDHAGQICKLTEEGIKSNKKIDQNFIDQFNKIIHQESIIIPIYHHADKWLVSNDLDPSTLPATTLYPQFELIRSR